MPKLIVIDRAGRSTAIDAASGLSVMENIRNAGIDELLALCGGCCSCATCHIHVGAAWTETVGPAGAEEYELLDSSDYRQAGSRLSCQVMMSDGYDGLVVKISPED